MHICGRRVSCTAYDGCARARGVVGRAPRFKKYCVTCHNPKIKTAGLAIDPAGAGNPSASAAIWEKVVRKLRPATMPPPVRRGPSRRPTRRSPHISKLSSIGRPRQSPHPGRPPLLHRLSRTEYQNAIRDLLAIDALPKEMDYSLLLPSDNISSGFDNIADLLFVSPTAMERYSDAARKISRLAVGDPDGAGMVNIYRLHP